MSKVLSSQQMNTASTSPKSRRVMNATLWTVQALLAVLFLSMGGMKLIVPVQELVSMMPLKLPDVFVHFIGVCEVAGALGLVLPALTHIRRELTTLAACALAIEMIGATTYTLLGGGGASALFPVLVGLLCAAVAYGRRSYFATA